MKRALLIIVLLLGAKGLFAQALYLPGKTVKGEGVEYEVFERFNRVEVRNVANKDMAEKGDSLGLPEVDDVFFVLTSDTASNGTEGIYRKVRIKQDVHVGDTFYVDGIEYELRSESRGMHDCSFMYSHTDAPNAPEYLRKRRVFLPKAFLEKIEAIDLGTNFPQFRDDQELKDLFLRLRMPGKDMDEIKQMSFIDIALDKSPKKPVWLIDRRYATKDEILLLEVSPGFVIDRFGVQKKK